jgi:hypothetical protein
MVIAGYGVASDFRRGRERCNPHPRARRRRVRQQSRWTTSQAARDFLDQDRIGSDEGRKRI